jgi:hypothetical protein
LGPQCSDFCAVQNVLIALGFRSALATATGPDLLAAFFYIRAKHIACSAQEPRAFLGTQGGQN